MATQRMSRGSLFASLPIFVPPVHEMGVTMRLTLGIAGLALVMACGEDGQFAAPTGAGDIAIAARRESCAKGLAPVIDGAICPGEWSGAARFSFSANLPEGGTSPATLFVMNDAANLYLAVRVRRSPTVDGGGQAVFEFDNDGDGLLENGNDVILYGSDGNFFDDFRTNIPPCDPGSAEGSCGFGDTNHGGTNDGDGAHGNDGKYAVYELVHPLNTTDDAHDFSLAAGETLGLALSIQLFSPGGVAGAVTLFPGPGMFSYTFITITP